MARILIIEDETAIAELERDYLELSGYEVTIAEDGLKGKRAALEEDYNLVILDLMLPGSDGFAICKAIREAKDIPILMVSAKKDEVDKIRGLGLGADDYMTKPFSPSELVARVKAHLQRYERLVGSGIRENKVVETCTASSRIRCKESCIVERAPSATFIRLIPSAALFVPTEYPFVCARSFSLMASPAASSAALLIRFPLTREVNNRCD